MILFPSVTKQAQGRVCKEGDWDNRWCEDELVIKDSTAVIAMCGIILTVLIACWLTYLFIREVRNARKASQIILKGFRADAENENQLPPINETANQVNLEMILEGSYLLKWTREWKRKVKDVQSGRDLAPSDNNAPIRDDASLASNASNPSIQGMSATTISPELKSYLVIDGGVRMLDEDVTQFASSFTARILRHLCEIPGLLEFLTHNPTDHSLWNFVTKCASYCQDLQDQFDRQAAANRHARTLPEWIVGLKGTPFPVTSLVKFEHRPIIAYWLMKGSEQEREHFCSLMHLIMKSNGAPHLHYNAGHFSRVASRVGPHAHDAHPPPDADQFSRAPSASSNDQDRTVHSSPIAVDARGRSSPLSATASSPNPPKSRGKRKSAVAVDSPALPPHPAKVLPAAPTPPLRPVSPTNGVRSPNGIRLESDVGMSRRMSIEVSEQPKQQADGVWMPPERTPMAALVGPTATRTNAESDSPLRAASQQGSWTSIRMHSRQGSARDYVENQPAVPPTKIEDRIYNDSPRLAMPVAGVDTVDLDV